MDSNHQSRSCERSLGCCRKEISGRASGREDVEHERDRADRAEGQVEVEHQLVEQGRKRVATGRLMFTVIGAVACFERELMLERQREGIAKAKAEKKYKGRKPTARARAVEISALKADGVRPVEIARRLGIGRASVYRVLGVRCDPARQSIAISPLLSQ